MAEGSRLHGHRRRFALATALVSSVACVGVGALLLEHWGFDVARGAWRLRNSILGRETVGIFDDDPVLGWRHTPNTSGRQREVPDFDVVYHIDAAGHRRVPDPAGSVAPAVVFLGGSFTFGHGVQDDAPYPALLQAEWPHVRVVNAAVNAWGTAHAWIALQQILEDEPDVALVVYGFIAHHLKRNHRSARWLTQLADEHDRRNPYFEIEGDGLVYRGLADPETDGLPDDRNQVEREVLMTVRLLKAMRTLCEARGIPFVVIHLPDWTDGRGRVVLEAGAGVDRVIDLSSVLDYDTLHFEHDIHPTPDGHRAIADAVRPRLEAVMAAQAP